MKKQIISLLIYENIDPQKIYKILHFFDLFSFMVSFLIQLFHQHEIDSLHHMMIILSFDSPLLFSFYIDLMPIFFIYLSQLLLILLFHFKLHSKIH